VTGQKLKIRQGKTIQILNESTLNTTETNEEYGCNVHKYQNSLMQSNNIQQQQQQHSLLSQESWG
jgi:prolyl-tRNA editing enzyme YbaK/EbsC (Cys-tRNA(Pro) deacylase)